jgi:ferredoxin
MNFEALRRRVQRAESLVEGRGQDTLDHWGQLRAHWRAGWTPWRIVIAGLGLGFVAGRAEPKAALGSLAGKVGAAPKLLQLISTLSALFTASQAQEASEQAERAADQAEDAADDCPQAAAAPAPPTDGRSAGGPRPTAPPTRPPEATAPSPAEAATEVSER